MLYQQGLGKTVISIAAVEELIEEGTVGGGFVICSTSLKRQWKDQILHFTGGEANIILVNGTPQQRQRQYVEYATGGAEYLILNIEQVVNDWKDVSRLPRDFVIADEVQFAKNFAPKRSKRLKQLQADYRWGLTGQPIENRPEDLFSIMQWVDPEVLGDWRLFDSTFIKRDNYGRVRRVVNLPILHERISEAMVRKTWDDEDVRDQMPKVSQQKLLVDFDIEAAKLYRTIRKDLLADLEEALGSNFNASNFYMGNDTSAVQLRGKIMSKMLCMRMLCDHPELLKLSADRATGRETRIRQGIRGGSQYAKELQERGLLDRLRKTPKMDAVVDEVTAVLDADERSKVVLFSFFKDMLHLLAAHEGFGVMHPILFTGEMNMDARAEALARFRADPESRILLSSDAGGVGVDIPFANYLFSYDLPWSFGAWQQRNARIIRISSEFDHVVTLAALMADTIEERQYASLMAKESVGKAIIDGKGWDDKGGLTIDLNSLREFLKEMDV